MSTYHDIYREFSKKFPDYEVDDYRPADLSLVFKEVNCTIPNAIIVWLKNGEKLVYISDEGRCRMKEEKHDCKTCKFGKNYENGYDVTTMNDECGGCCSWNDKWQAKEEGAE